MKFSLQFDMDNAAFGDTFEDRAGEAARILRECAKRVERGLIVGESVIVRDVNGNRIGSFVASYSSAREEQESGE